MASPEDSPRIVQLKIRLLGLSHMIWRRVLAPESVTLRDLHDILQVGMGWDGIHLYYFDIHAARFELHAEGPDISLSRFRIRAKDRFSYLCDMGDCWEHEVRIEQFLERKSRRTHAVCTGGSGACPPEDWGGPAMARRGDGLRRLVGPGSGGRI